jgi:peptide/nickel transport system permease protein
MLRLTFRRILSAIPLLLAVSFVTFFLLFHSPGNYLDSLRLNPQISKEFLDAETKKMGLDRPFYIVWLKWLWGIVRHGEFGASFHYKVPVTEMIGSRIWATFLLSLTSTLFAWVLAIPLGIAAATNHNGIIDRLASAVAFVGLSIPAVLLALFAIYLAAVSGWFPTGDMRSLDYYNYSSVWRRMQDIGYHIVLPTVVLGVGGLAIYTRQMRSNLLETLRTDYMRTALSKGLPYWSAVWRHALRNAINPLITLFGFAFSELLSGAVLVENVFAWPGLGRTTIEALLQKDMYVVATSVLMATALLMLGNLLADLLLAANDPRIRYD